MSAVGRHPYGVVLGLLCLVLVCIGWHTGFADLWSTPDQRGRWLMAQGRYDEAGETFADPMWQGAALMRARNFKAAAQAFGGMETAEAAYDQGNALVMLGKYQEAIARYTRALAMKPDLADAEANLSLARLRLSRLQTQEGQPGDMAEPDEPSGLDELPPRKGPDDASAKADQPGGDTVMSDEAVRALWLRRVETRPADFLRARFAHQLQAGAPKP